MASTIRKDEETKEFFDSPEELDLKVTQLAAWIRESKHFIVFTGAGISTSAGIPDFRSGMNTKLETGPGVWELRAKGVGRNVKHKVTTTAKAIPTATHMSFVQLMKEGILHAVISQNTDGLHRRSGLPATRLYELHGNSNLEKCSKCKREYLRDFRTRTSHGVFFHKTGRKCDDPACRGDLEDTIINFGESLPKVTLEDSFEHAERADLCLAMGSSLTVTPAADIPQTVGQRRRRLVIVNLQKTPLDGYAALRISGKCDDVMKLLMSKLSLEIPEFRLNRRVMMSANAKDDQYEVSVEGRDQEDLPFSFLKSVTFSGVGPDLTCDKEPYTAMLRGGGEVRIVLGFHSHYGEPPLELKLSLTRDKAVMVDLQYNPFTGVWAVSRSDEDKSDSPADPVQDLATKLSSTSVGSK